MEPEYARSGLECEPDPEVRGLLFPSVLSPRNNHSKMRSANGWHDPTRAIEPNLFRYLAKLGADGILVRNAGGLYFCAERSIPFIADFSLNAANPLTVELIKSRGAMRVTASYDLNSAQLFDLIDAVPPDWLEVVIHQQIPMFHMEHCVYCAFLSPGTDQTSGEISRRAINTASPEGR